MTYAIDSENFDRYFGTQIKSFCINPNQKNLRKDISPDHIARQNARAVGERCYTHSKPCRVCGCHQRIAQNNKCVQCKGVKS